MLSRLHPEVLRFLNQKGTDQLPGLNLTMTVVAAGLSLFASHILDTLREEVFEARRLNQYQLDPLIGVGGMGEVYFAEHRLLRRTCAIKLIESTDRTRPGGPGAIRARGLDHGPAVAPEHHRDL